MRRRWRNRILAAAALAVLAAYPAATPARAASGSPDNGAAPSPPGGEPSAAPPAEALRHKEAGDGFRRADDIARAGEEYSKALSLSSAFSREERLTMARYLSWSGRLDEAIGELSAILAEEPGNTAARIHLARCLAWKGDPAASLEESSKVLAEQPDNREALLVRANALKWSGNPSAAIAIYKALLTKEEDFDTRLALSQAYLSGGYVRGAREGASLLAPAFPYQVAEKRGLDNGIDRATRPTLEGDYSYYHDSDENRVDRYSLSGAFWTGAWKWGLAYLYSDARAPGLGSSDHDLSLSVDSWLSERLSVGGFAGVNRPSGDNAGTFLTGGVRAEGKVLDGSAGGGIARRGFPDTAELIRNGIRYTEYSAYFEHPLPRSFSTRLGFAYKDYSDGNGSQDWQGALRYAIPIRTPSLSAAYRIRFLDFRRESGGGYFDPSNYLSHKLELSIGYERGRGYARLVPFGGYQSFRRKGKNTDGFFDGAEGLLGYRVTDSFALELHGEGSDEAGGTASGFNYYQFGLRGRLTL